MRSRRAAKSRQDSIGVALIIFSAAAVVGVLVWAAIVRSSKAQLDPKTLCPVDAPTSITAVIVDATDALDPVQREQVGRLLKDLKDDIPKNGEVELYTVGTSDTQLLRPELDICNPGSGSTASPYYENQKRMQLVWRDRYSNKVDEVLTRLLTEPSKNTSPIMESVQAAAVQAFIGQGLNAIPKRLVIVSDMLQNTTGLSQYSRLESFDRFKASPYYIKVRPDLRGVEVEIYYLRRTDGVRVQGVAHINFWQSFFAASGATLTHVVSIEG
jgi:hypothetical protein